MLMLRIRSCQAPQSHAIKAGMLRLLTLRPQFLPNMQLTRLFSVVAAVSLTRIAVASPVPVPAVAVDSLEQNIQERGCNPDETHNNEGGFGLDHDAGKGGQDRSYEKRGDLCWYRAYDVVKGGQGRSYDKREDEGSWFKAYDVDTVEAAPEN
ncbi:hypothetical protein B0H21DRAFT_736783 [Amylocystis lapponica]|nr:hypothetical protein B0H21DRAFT_736783 [Amylocystis lapponica]